MRLAHVLVTLATTVTTALALTASVASAQITVSPEVPSSPSCGTVTLGSSHVVTGGCHAEFSSSGIGVTMHAYVPAKTTIMACEWNLEARIGSNGEGHFTQLTLGPPHGGATPCTRAACDEPNGTKIPWPLHIEELGPLSEELETVICLRPTSVGQGGSGNRCELHLELREIAEHSYELGHFDPVSEEGTEVFCENSPPNGTAHPTLPFPISMEPHLGTSGTERIEINHELL